MNAKSPNADLAVAPNMVLASPEALQVFMDNAGAVTADTSMDLSGVSSPGAGVILGWLASDVAAMANANANATAAELEELHRQSQLLLNGETTVDDDDDDDALDKVMATARQ